MWSYLLKTIVCKGQYDNITYKISEMYAKSWPGQPCKMRWQLKINYNYLPVIIVMQYNVHIKYNMICNIMIWNTEMHYDMHILLQFTTIMIKKSKFIFLFCT